MTPSTTSRRRSAVTGALVLGMSALLAGVVTEVVIPQAMALSGGNTSGGTAGAGSAPATRVVNPGVCDVDGVRVSYVARYAAGPAAGYRVVGVAIRELDASCSGARVTLTLSEGTQVTAGDAVVSGIYNPNSDATLSLALLAEDAPLAADVALATVTLAGGSYPIPASCTMALERSFLGTTDSDAVASLTGTNQNDFMTGLSGNDTYDALNGDDCVRAGDGDNVIRLGNGADVVVAGDGDNRVTVAAGAGATGDVVRLGDGDNIVDIGTNGGNDIRLGTGDNVVNVGNGDNTVTVAGGGARLTRISTGTGRQLITVRAGKAVVRVAGGDGSRILLGDGDDEVHLSSGREVTVAVSGGRDVCHVTRTVRRASMRNDLGGCDAFVVTG